MNLIDVSSLSLYQVQEICKEPLSIKIGSLGSRSVVLKDGTSLKVLDLCQRINELIKEKALSLQAGAVLKARLKEDNRQPPEQMDLFIQKILSHFDMFNSYNHLLHQTAKNNEPTNETLRQETEDALKEMEEEMQKLPQFLEFIEKIQLFIKDLTPEFYKNMELTSSNATSIDECTQTILNHSRYLLKTFLEKETLTIVISATTWEEAIHSFQNQAPSILMRLLNEKCSKIPRDKWDTTFILNKLIFFLNEAESPSDDMQGKLLMECLLCDYLQSNHKVLERAIRQFFSNTSVQRSIEVLFNLKLTTLSLRGSVDSKSSLED